MMQLSLTLFLFPVVHAKCADEDKYKVVGDMGSSGTRLYKFSPGKSKQLLGEKLPQGLSKVCAQENGGVVGVVCQTYLKNMIDLLKDPCMESASILGTAGLRQLEVQTKKIILEKLVEMANKEQTLEGKIEARSIAGFEEAAAEFVAVKKLLWKENNQPTGHRGYFGMGGASVQFAVETNDGVLLQSYPYGMDQAWDKYQQNGDGACEFSGKEGTGKECLEKITEVFAREKSLADEIQQSKPLPTREQWQNAELIAVSFFHVIQDFLAYHANPKEHGPKVGTKAAKVDLKWMKDNAELLCDKTADLAMKPDTTVEEHKKFGSRKFVEPVCFQATYIVYLLQQLHVPEDKKIAFRGTINGEEAEWTLGIYEGGEDLAKAVGPGIQNGCDREDNFAPKTSFPTCLCGTATCKQEEHSGCDVFNNTCKQIKVATPTIKRKWREAREAIQEAGTTATSKQRSSGQTFLDSRDTITP